MKKQDARAIKKEIAPYEKSNTKNSIRQVINTFVPFIALWILAYQSLSISYILTAVFCIVAAGFLVRIFIIFHDCTHGSFFKNRTANRILGTITGVLTLFPFEQWKRSHSIHHATSGNLDKRGTGDVWVMTIDEYLEATPMQRLAYRIYRNPFVMFGLGPIYVFLISNRFNVKDARKKERNNTYLTNLLIVGISGLLCWAIGWQSFLLVQFPIFFISGSLGIWLFYVQHQFEDSYFENQDDWDYVKAAMDGSSYYKLPKVLQWLTGNIGFHHIHHLSPRVPNYYLEELHNTNPRLQDVPTITIKKSLTSLHFRLWDEKNKNFIGFKELKTISEKRSELRSNFN
ncbi:fatty acid desaturase [Lederbergia citrea]|uniref:Fatty acid desaturase n=1 Tax=Lederbergia citrea TaxID=2833581 RepID=A0A942UNF7_9BACI|nr:fatty acid desaturase [Lederbergia citrea]MBS4176839.1 fatty acid desaturase [Lederbergia citrea]MBS4203399.1 fatty acid desaturase [Lederbergia citrea]MBS4221928.1 fatty acid desaturase [Lederbergia citrea]